MKSRFCLFLALLWLTPAGAVSLDLTQSNLTPIGSHIEYLQETDARLNLEQAMQAYDAGAYLASADYILSFGVGARPVWLRIQADNPLSTPILQRLSIETSWLDRLEVFFIAANGQRELYHAGDLHAYNERPIAGRFFSFDHHFAPGSSTIYIRVETPDPMVIPVYLTTVEAAYEREQDSGYLYGFIYGVIVALLGYNLMLFISLGAWRYFYFAVYLSAFLAMNMSYTGHAFMWLWPGLPGWQLWANHILILLFPISGLIFATIFLNTKHHFPRLHGLVMTACLIFLFLESLAILAHAQAVALIISFIFIFGFSIIMVGMGSLSLLAGNKSAKYFLIASITHVTGSSITAMTTWALIPYSVLGYHAIEIGMMLDAVLLAMALADQFRHVQEQKMRAEHLAMLDPLTGINNRRAFYQYAKPLWDRALEQQHDMAVMMLDIDMFKDINDRYGHAQGDQVLALIANTLKECTRTSDVIARWGGEEFVVLLPRTPEASAMTIAERCREQLSVLRLRVEEGEIQLTVSLGVAYTSQPQGNLDNLLAQADAHLYEAKRMGRNRVYPRLVTA